MSKRDAARPALEKNARVTVACRALGAELEGVCDAQGVPLFVPGVLPGETADALVVKSTASYAHGRLMALVGEPSPERCEPFCPHDRLCGGCAGQHMTYAATLEAKRRQAFDCLRRIGGLALSEDDVPTPIAAQQPLHYRNKTALPVGGTADAPVLGFYRRRSHDVIDVDDCPIARGPVAGVVSAVKAWMRAARVAPYDERTGRGTLRHVLLRVNRAGDAMVMLAAAADRLPRVPLLTELLAQRAPDVRSLILCPNFRRDNVILGETSVVLHGEPFITETLLGLTFEVPPLSFFQVNPEQTERLYQTALAFADLQPDDTCVDAYCGAGTITLCAARACQRAIGIEAVPPAVAGANRNKARNAIDNAEFRLGTVETALPELVADGLRPDVVLLDPPRKGVELPVIAAIAQARPRRVVYVSCHVPTQARDIKLLCEQGYRFERCQPVDMFCYAAGVENVALLTRADG